MLRIAVSLLAFSAVGAFHLSEATQLRAQTTVSSHSSVGSSMPTMNSGFHLNPGERVVAINGVPVQNSMPMANGSTAVRSVSAQRAVPMQSHGQAGYSNGLIVNRDPNAYAHALREAQILASRGENYHRHGDGGHPLGIAPGCRYSGTGYSRDPNRPNHCYYGEMPDSRLVARAMVPGPNGTYYWSAHYR